MYPRQIYYIVVYNAAARENPLETQDKKRLFIKNHLKELLKNGYTSKRVNLLSLCPERVVSGRCIIHYFSDRYFCPVLIS